MPKDPSPPEGTDGAPPSPPTQPPAASASATAPPEKVPEPDAAQPVFEFDDDRRFELYMAQRESYSKGARESYQRFDQLIVGVSAGSIVLSITFLKDIGHAPHTLKWLLGSWGAFLISSFCALLSLVTSAKADIEERDQLDCQVETGSCDETKATRLGNITSALNWIAFGTVIAGVLLIMWFAVQNVLQFGGVQWGNPASGQAAQPPPVSSSPEKTAVPAASEQKNPPVLPPALAPPGSSRSETASPIRKLPDQKEPTPATVSHHP